MPEYEGLAECNGGLGPISAGNLLFWNLASSCVCGGLGANPILAASFWRDSINSRSAGDIPSYRSDSGGGVRALLERGGERSAVSGAGVLSFCGLVTTSGCGFCGGPGTCGVETKSTLGGA